MSHLPEKLSYYCRDPELATYVLAQSVSIDDEELFRGLQVTEVNASLQRKTSKRQQEFRRSRYLFHDVTGCCEALLNDHAGSPIWPPPFRGSLSHKDGHVALAITTNQSITTLGLDLESISKVHLGLEPRICTKQDSETLQALCGRQNQRRQELLCAIFSFKEALFKAINPLSGIYFGFQDAETIILNPSKGTITMRLLKDTAPRTPAGFIAEGSYRKIELDGTAYILSLFALRASSCHHQSQSPVR